MKKLCLTPTSVKYVIDEFHDMYGHIGPLKCFRMLNESFYYPKFAKTIRQMISSYPSCQLNKVANQTCFSEMRNVTPSKPGELLSIDFYGPLPATRGGFKYILSTIDTFRKLVKLYPMRRATTRNALTKILEDYIPNYGKPDEIIYDHGTQFTSKNGIDALKQENIPLIFSSMRHPQRNMVERIHRELSRFFRSLLGGKHNS